MDQAAVAAPVQAIVESRAAVLPVKSKMAAMESVENFVYGSVRYPNRITAGHIC